MPQAPEIDNSVHVQANLAFKFPMGAFCVGIGGYSVRQPGFDLKKASR